MKTFDDEYKELVLWLKERRRLSHMIPDDKFVGRDGSERHLQEQKDDHEYRERLRALRDKYNIPQPSYII